MRARNEPRESVWHLAVIVYAIVVLSAATDTCGFLRFAPTLGVPAWAGLVCVIPIKLIEWQFLTFATRLWDAGVLGKFAWPVVAPNIFGQLLKIAVREVGGRKLKSNLQIYEGVGIPAAWSMQTAA